MNIEFGNRLREERKRLGLTLEELGAAGGVKQNAQGQYERGERSPTAEYLTLVMQAGIDVMYVLSGLREDRVPEGSLDIDNQGQSIGLRLMRERARLGLPENAMADACGVSVRSYCRFERDGEMPSSVLQRLAQAGVDVQYLLTGTHGGIASPGAQNMLIPDELAGIVNAWLSLWLNRTIDEDTVNLWTELVNRMNPAYTRAPLSITSLPVTTTGSADLPGSVFSRKPGAVKS